MSRALLSSGSENSKTVDAMVHDDSVSGPSNDKLMNAICQLRNLYKFIFS